MTCKIKCFEMFDQISSPYNFVFKVGTARTALTIETFYNFCILVCNTVCGMKLSSRSSNQKKLVFGSKNINNKFLHKLKTFLF